MQLATGVDAIDLGIYLPSHKTLVFSDFHMGFEHSLNAQGYMLPRTHYKDVVDRLELIFAELKKQKKDVKKIVITGDLKHEFGTILRQEWRDVLRLVDYLLRKADELILIKGNHDVQLGPVAAKSGIKLVADVKLGDILIIHGDEEPARLKDIKTIIMGHEHPALGLRHKGRTEKYKCYLVGPYRKCTLIVQPSAKLMVEGSDVTKEKQLSPLLAGGVKKFRAFVIDERQKEILDFGLIKNL